MQRNIFWTKQELTDSIWTQTLLKMKKIPHWKLKAIIHKHFIHCTLHSLYFVYWIQTETDVTVCRYLQKKPNQTLEKFALNCTVRIKLSVRRLTWPQSPSLNLDLLLSQYSFQWQRKSVLDMTVIICALKAFYIYKVAESNLKKNIYVCSSRFKKKLNLDYEDIFSFTYTHKEFTKQDCTESCDTAFSRGPRDPNPRTSKCYL